MNVNQAQQVQQEEEKRKKDLEESKKTLENDRIRKIKEKEEAEKKARQEEIKKEKKRYPDFAAEIYMPKCWNCKEKNINMSQGEMFDKNTKIVIIKECPRCGVYNIATIPTKLPTTSNHDKFLPAVNLR